MAIILQALAFFGISVICFVIGLRAEGFYYRRGGKEFPRWMGRSMFFIVAAVFCVFALEEWLFSSIPERTGQSSKF
jgi:hypothetical protein